ncbi:formate dehydrogenase [Massilia sp.]|uniref:formate dehydrogenase n=1 Tax=Massilia sp. TaxID=1882437 RepID=UPI00391919F6
MEQHPQGLEQGPDGKPAGPQHGQPDRGRRGFLKAAPLGALAVVAGTAEASEAAAPVPAAAPQVKRGYHETEHIRRYYETAAYW